MLRNLILILVLVLILNDELKLFLMKQFFFKKKLHELSKKRDKEIHENIKKYFVGENLKILNFGCGLNTYAELLSALGHSVISLDIVDQNISSLPVLLYDGENIPENLNDFDYTIISTVLHHIPINSQFDILKKLKNISKNIIVIEDYTGEGVCSFIKTAAICALANFSFLDREYSFRSRDEWLKLFEELKPKNIIHTFNKFDFFLIEIK